MNLKLVVLVFLATIASNVAAAAVSSHSLPLTQTNREYNGVPNGVVGPQPFGFVIFVKAINQLVATASLQGASPDTGYNARLIQLKNGAAVSCGPCSSGGATLKTDKNGFGTVQVQNVVSAGATASWFVLNKKTDCNSFHDTALQTF
ncbi:hypothetical protein N7451_006677 [Penicillium sp. IBT 35674x]|nr:hypothetical protein N7451_006677 [Penicillium sp. IBT 35674x]